MKHYNLSQKYFDEINKILLDINNKLINNKSNENISQKFLIEIKKT